MIELDDLPLHRDNLTQDEYGALWNEAQLSRVVIKRLLAVRHYIPLGALWDELHNALMDYERSLLNAKGSGE